MLIMSVFVLPQGAMAQSEMASNTAMQSAVCKLLAMQGEKSKATMSSRVAGAQYQEGLDAYGNLVVPADVNNLPSSESIIIPIEIDLADRFDIPELGEAQVNTAEIQPDGRVLFANNDVTGKMHDWCGTPVPEDLDIIKPKIETPSVTQPSVNEPEKTPIKQPDKVEVQPVEIKPVIAKPPLDIEDNKASNETNVQNITNDIKDIITGTDYSGYNE
jgi:hypothetical protein